VERWPIDQLIPYAKNSRTHSEAQIAQLAASMKEWGWTNPVLADEAGGGYRGPIRCRGRATCGCLGGIVSSTATAQ
jgi:ParB-like chromosome segregation protein Spo0J